MTYFTLLVHRLIKIIWLYKYYYHSLERRSNAGYDSHRFQNLCKRRGAVEFCKAVKKPEDFLRMIMHSHTVAMLFSRR